MQIDEAETTCESSNWFCFAKRVRIRRVRKNSEKMTLFFAFHLTTHTPIAHVSVCVCVCAHRFIGDPNMSYSFTPVRNVNFSSDGARARTRKKKILHTENSFEVIAVRHKSRGKSGKMMHGNGFSASATSKTRGLSCAFIRPTSRCVCVCVAYVVWVLRLHFNTMSCLCALARWEKWTYASAHNDK